MANFPLNCSTVSRSRLRPQPNLNLRQLNIILYVLIRFFEKMPQTARLLFLRAVELPTEVNI